MYHRIAEPLTDTWNLAVSPENFEEHLKVLKEYKLIPVSELDTILTKNKQIPANTVLLTFDDGYRDNYLIAKPLLEKYKVPATFFITTNAIGKQDEFWWDALERICLETPELPSKLILQEPYNIIFNISSSPDSDFLSPLDLYVKLSEFVRKMKAVQRREFIKMMEVWAENDKARPDYFTMDEKDLLDLHSNELFTIGAHTLSHPFLPDLDYEDQKSEIQDSIAYLNSLTGIAPKYFAYPHGARDENTLDILSESGISLGFTTDPYGFKTDTNKIEIPRFQVNNWDMETFANHLEQWMKPKEN